MVKMLKIYYILLVIEKEKNQEKKLVNMQDQFSKNIADAIEKGEVDLNLKMILKNFVKNFKKYKNQADILNKL